MFNSKGMEIIKCERERVKNNNDHKYFEDFVEKHLLEFWTRSSFYFVPDQFEGMKWLDEDKRTYIILLMNKLN